MKVIHKLLNFRPIKSDLLVVFGIEGKKTNLPSEVSLPVSATKSFQGKAKETRVTDAVKGPFQQVMLIGLGEVKKIDAETFATLQEMLYKFKGFFVRTRSARKYPVNTASNMMGYLGEVNNQNICLNNQL